MAWLAGLCMAGNQSSVMLHQHLSWEFLKRNIAHILEIKLDTQNTAQTNQPPKGCLSSARLPAVKIWDLNQPRIILLWSSCRILLSPFVGFWDFVDLLIDGLENRLPIIVRGQVRQAPAQPLLGWAVLGRQMLGFSMAVGGQNWRIPKIGQILWSREF